jgi:hypothetical protein
MHEPREDRRRRKATSSDERSVRKCPRPIWTGAFVFV